MIYESLVKSCFFKSAKLKKLPTARGESSNQATTNTTKLPPVKAKNDPSRYCHECKRKTGIATSYTCR